MQDCQFSTFQDHQMCVEKTLANADWVPNFQMQTWLFNVVSLADFLNVTFQCPVWKNVFSSVSLHVPGRRAPVG